MRIIHGKDYYDSAHHGVDPEIVFERDGVVPDNIDFDDFPFTPRNWRDFSSSSAGELPALSLDYVLFAGDVFPVMRVIHPAPEEVTPAGHRYRLSNLSPAEDLLDKDYDYSSYSVDYIYDGKEAERLFSELRAKGAEGDSLFSARRFEMVLFDHFATKNPKWGQWLIERGIVTGYIHSKTMKDEIKLPSHKRTSSKKMLREMVAIYVNGDFLKEVKFYAVKDAFTANQDIAQFVGGVLPSNQNPTVELTDIDKVQKAGFDKRTSFRRSPTKR